MSKEEMKLQKQERLENKLAENSESLEKVVELMKVLDDAGALDILVSLVRHRDDALENITKEANKERYAKVLENLSGFLFLLGELDVEKVTTLTGRINKGMEGAIQGSETEERTSVLDLAKALKDPEINRGITMMLHMLKGLGKQPEK